MSTLERALEAGLRIRPGEQRRVALMAAYAANAVGALVVGRSVRDALFLAHRPAKDLAGMYVWSSLVIVLVSWLYARVADRVPRGQLNAICAALCALACVAFRAVLMLGDAAWIYSALYVFVDVMGSLVVIQFWTMANDVFHAREAKRLFGLIGGGGTLANVVFGLLVGSYASVVGAPNLILLMVVQLGFCALLALEGAKLSSAAAPQARSRLPRKAALLSRAGLSFLDSPHLRLVALIGAVSAVAITIVDFQFKLSAAAVLRQDELAGYFGRFYGICGGVALAVQLWITGRVLERYGILASLLPLPLGLAVGSGTAAVLPNPGLFVSSLAKGSDTVFRYTINDASMQLLYVPVQPHVRGRAKAFIDGVLKPVSVALAGAGLLVYKQAGLAGRPLTVAVIGLVAVWEALLVRARGEYVRSLVTSLGRRHLDLSGSQFAGANEATARALRTALRGDAATALHALGLLGQLKRASDVTPELRALLGHEDPRLRAAAAEQLGELRRADALEQVRALLGDPAPEVRAAAIGALCAIEQEGAVSAVLPFLSPATAPEAVVRAAAAVALIRHAGLDGMLAAVEPLKQLTTASDPRDRAPAPDALGSIGVKGLFRPLLSFHEDPDVRVRRRAIAAAARLRAAELTPALIRQLERRETALEAASALTAMGPAIEPQLEAALLDEAASCQTRRGVILVLQRLATREGAEARVAAPPAGPPPARNAAARSLSRLSRRQRQLQIDTSRLQGAARQELEAANATLSAFKRLGLPQPAQTPTTPKGLLALALLEERDARVLQALLLLEVLLPQARLDVVAENLRSESAAARANAIEVLDNALPEPWKRLALTALDEARRRGDEISADARGPAEVAAALIAGASGEWVGACAARWSIDGEVPLRPLIPALEGALHAPAAALREAAAVALARLAPRAIA